MVEQTENKDKKNTIKEKFIRLLRSTNRAGIENVLSWLEQSDFFVAPASTVFHGNYEGGLAEHSYEVALTAKDLRDMLIKRKPEIEQQVSRESIIIAALLHDVCKTNIYKKTTKYRKNDYNQWETYEAYNVDYSELPVGHGEKSVIRLLRLGLEMTDDEILAIRWHMSAWDMPFQSVEAKGNLFVAKEKSPLLSIIQAADELTSALIDHKSTT
ncbi:MAG: HD domain-containing protein [Paludibacteraceae bacterium]|nr:HD domain-containing protein [Paludibacteraceae bacterium]